MSQRHPTQGNLPTKPISFDATGNLDLAPRAGQQTAHLSGTFGKFIENKVDTRFFPLNMSGLAPRSSGVFQPENYDQSQLNIAISMKTIKRPTASYLAPNQAPQLY